MKAEMIYRMEGARALVTGAGSGIGKSTAVALAEAGAKVALLSRTPEEIEAVAAQIGGKDAGHLVLTADVSKESDMTCSFRADQGRVEWPRLRGGQRRDQWRLGSSGRNRDKGMG